MRRRQFSPNVSSYSFGPGPLPPAVKALIIANVACFIAQLIEPRLQVWFGLIPATVLDGQIWRAVTYMFLHTGPWHLLFNMLALWMFGTELEGTWGTRYFVKYYAVSGIGAGLLTVLLSLLPFDFARQLYRVNILGASGAIYGLLIAYGIYFSNRPIYMYLVFPIPAKYFVMIIGAMAFYSSLTEAGGIASATHLSGLLVGYLYLKGGRIHPLSEIKYRYVKWKINRARKKFDVYSGGRASDWDRRVH